MHRAVTGASLWYVAFYTYGACVVSLLVVTPPRAETLSSFTPAFAQQWCVCPRSTDLDELRHGAAVQHALDLTH